MMGLPSGWNTWPLTAFDRFNDLDPAKVRFVFLTLSTGSASSVGCMLDWNTWNGKCDIEIYTPISQNVLFNCAVLYAM